MEVTATILLGLINRLVEGFKAFLSSWSVTKDLDSQTRTITIIVFAGFVGAVLALIGKFDPLGGVSTLADLPAWVREIAAGIALSFGSAGVQWLLDLVKAITTVQVARAESIKAETAYQKSYQEASSATATLQPVAADITSDFVDVLSKAVADEVMRRLDEEDKLVPDAAA